MSQNNGPALMVSNALPIDDIANDDDGIGVFEQALARFDAITSAQQEERALNLRDRRFATIAGAQWEDQWGLQWENSIRVEINKTAMGVERIIADYREHRLETTFRGVDKGADEDTAELLNGMFRADYYRSKGGQATDSAFEEAVMGGIGAWRLTTSYCDPYDPDDDRQQIDFMMVPDADQCVFWDLDARLQDKSDAKFCFVLSALSPDSYRETYDDDPASWPTNLLKTHYDWYTPDVVYVAEYYVVEIKKQKLYLLTHTSTGEEQRLWSSDLGDDGIAGIRAEGWAIERIRSVPRRRVRKYVMSAAGLLGETNGVIIAGDQIPIIPVYGKRWFVDNMERTRGHVRLAVDPQRVYNTQTSKLVEIASYSPIERPYFAPEQVAGLEQSFADANINRAPYQLVKPLTDPATGAYLPVSALGMLSPPQIPPVIGALLQIAGQDIADLTSADDGADQAKSNVSAEAMDIAAARTDKRSYTYIDNMRQATQRGGEVWLSIAREVYIEERREIDTVGPNGEQDTAILSQPKTDPKTGAYYYANDIQKGRYKVIADVTEATATRRDKTVKTCLSGAEIVGAIDPELAGALITTAFLNMDGEGVHDMQEWLRKRAVGSGLVKPTEEEQKEIDAAKAQQGQQPDPQALLLNAQLAGAQAETEKTAALAQKAKADTGLSQANTDKARAETIKTLAQAHEHHASAADKGRFGVVDRITAAMKAFAKPRTHPDDQAHEMALARIPTGPAT